MGSPNIFCILFSKLLPSNSNWCREYDNCFWHRLLRVEHIPCNLKTSPFVIKSHDAWLDIGKKWLVLQSAPSSHFCLWVSLPYLFLYLVKSCDLLRLKFLQELLMTLTISFVLGFSFSHISVHSFTIMSTANTQSVGHF